MSEVSIANSALAKMGEYAVGRITAFTDGTRPANIAGEQFDKIRDDLLRSHPWNFATKRLMLARSANTPPFQYSYQYPIPSDFLRALIVSDNTSGSSGIDYRMGYDDTDGRVFMTNAPQLYLVYVAKITNTGYWPPDFQEAMAFRLAAEFAIPLTQSTGLYTIMMQEFRDALAAAKSTDGMEDNPEPRPAGTWVEVRDGRYGQWD